MFNERLQDPEHCETMIKRFKLATKTKPAREDKVSDRLNPSRTPKSDQQASMPQGQVLNSQFSQLQQM